MPTIIFEKSSLGPQRVSEETTGGKLVDVCDDVDAPVPFSCRAATCATCRVRVVEGVELLHPPNFDENDILQSMHEPPNVRLACSARFKAGPGVIRLQVVDDVG